MIHYPHFIGDYARDTQDLTLMEHGAYRVLLDHYYAQHGDVPADVGKLYRVCNAVTAAERKAVQSIADRFFSVNGDGRRHNRRADEEIAKAKDWGQSTDARRENERERQRRHRERRQKLFADLRALGVTPKFDTTTEELERQLNALRTGGVTPPVTEPVTQSVTRDVTANHNHNHTHKPQESNTSAANAAEGRDGVATLPDCPQEQLLALYHELLHTCTRIEKWTPARQQAMRARWRDEAKPNREKHRGYRTVEEGLAYWRKFFAWCAESTFLTGNAPGRDGKPPFVASLPWLIKAENFAKVIEGTYHREL
jgi:uncharacterized protein YdaU (DUF1376 family)